MRVNIPKISMVLALSLSPVTAFAYFDPGTGSLLIQALVGAIAAVTLFWGNLKVRVRDFFSRGKPEADARGGKGVAEPTDLD